jgi:hypothetical protein
MMPFIPALIPPIDRAGDSMKLVLSGIIHILLKIDMGTWKIIMPSDYIGNADEEFLFSHSSFSITTSIFPFSPSANFFASFSEPTIEP